MVMSGMQATHRAFLSNHSGDSLTHVVGFRALPRRHVCCGNLSMFTLDGTRSGVAVDYAHDASSGQLGQGEPVCLTVGLTRGHDGSVCRERLHREAVTICSSARPVQTTVQNSMTNQWARRAVEAKRERQRERAFGSVVIQSLVSASSLCCISQWSHVDSTWPAGAHCARLVLGLPRENGGGGPEGRGVHFGAHRGADRRTRKVCW